ncbi:SARP family transcriptional regulator [Streptomyces sp. NBC_01283]|uniref:AfsR/SARP family transcriptional regulator n=1 Tax=Streptomyces sp. NBC_01283 TaxID=2903812 RepID=UPI00352EDADF|nr:SARP family transcriptional regulator [Streptomyces sp. NBC_01283]
MAVTDRPGVRGDAPPALRLRLLGGFHLSRGEGDGGGQVDVSASGQQLLALLGLRGPVTRSALAGTLWPDVTEERARACLRTAIWRLNDASSAVGAPRPGVLALSRCVRLDIQDFTATAHHILAAPAEGTGAACSALMGMGELLPGWHQDWVVFERERLHQLRLHALEALSARLVVREQYAPALEAALESTRIDPLRESAHRAVVTVHLAENNLAEAVRHFKAFRGLLRTELGIEPSEQFRTMVRRALT